MKIALIIRKLNVKGGTQRQMLSLARELAKRGHNITIYAFAYDRGQCYPELLAGMKVIAFPETLRQRPTYYSNYALSVLREAREAKEFAKMMARDFDILNPHDQVAYKVSHYYKKYVKNIPSVWNMNDAPSLRWGYDKMRGVDETFRQPLFKRIFYFLFDWYDNMRFIRSQDAIAVVDNFNRGLVKKYLRREAIVVRNGPDLKHFLFKPRTPPGKHVKILTSGILLPHRRFEDAIEAVRILADTGYNPKLSIIGDTDNDRRYYTKLTALVERLGMQEHVLFRGRVSEQELIDAYESNDIYTFQHHLQSDGLSPFEAAACGMPIIVSRTAGCHEVLTDRQNALFVEPKNPRDLAGRIQELCARPDLYMKLSEAGNSFVRGNFSWDRYAEAMLSLFAAALKK